MTVANTAPTSTAFEVSTRHGQQVAVCVSGSGKPVVLLNGLSRPMASWSAFTPVLGGRMVVCFDAPGVGASTTPKLPLSMQALSDIVADVLDAVDVERSDIVGFSHGGAIAQQFAYSSPERVRRLALLSTSCGSGATPGSGKKLWSNAIELRNPRRWGPARTVGALWQVAAVASWSSIPFLGSISAPTLVVSGGHDRIVPPPNSHLLAARIPRAVLSVVAAGHDLQRPDVANTVAGRVLRFLDGPVPENVAAEDGPDLSPCL
ncbi:alpha/beta fold hydrolase [Rhodococcus sp. NPDC127530]|uniref:alpha/beta fold hydrolase n=1 Tax=unclassified Rhodococcus (in: high G+C Gram-positive bacteria) TaxID=192944 RepID=UPI003645E447